jgi:hypothetical protein
MTNWKTLAIFAACPVLFVVIRSNAAEPNAPPVLLTWMPQASQYGAIMGNFWGSPLISDHEIAKGSAIVGWEYGVMGGKIQMSLDESTQSMIAAQRYLAAAATNDAKTRRARELEVTLQKRKLARLRRAQSAGRSRADFQAHQAEIARQEAILAAMQAEQQRRYLRANTPESRIVTKDSSGRTVTTEIYRRDP